MRKKILYNKKFALQIKALSVTFLKIVSLWKTFIQVGSLWENHNVMIWVIDRVDTRFKITLDSILRLPSSFIRKTARSFIIKSSKPLSNVSHTLWCDTYWPKLYVLQNKIKIYAGLQCRWSSAHNVSSVW